MSTKIGIYITGLGQSIDNESVEKYMERLKNELSFTTTGFEYYLKTEKMLYYPEKESTLVSLIKKNKESEKEEVIYKMYDFKYHDILTDKFRHYNILLKNLILFGLILKKTPQICLSIFKDDGFDRPYQTFYAFLMIFVISLCVLFLIPACIGVMTNETFIQNLSEAIKGTNLEASITNFLTTINNLKDYGNIILPVTTLILLLAPQSKTLITSLATEFACVDSYIHNGEQSQILLGNLDLLVEYIAENEPDPEIHFHSYSFGSILAMDALFPTAEIPPSDNIKKLVKLLITTGNPFGFINAYYPNFYNRRSPVMKNSVKWLNIYSVSDVFATNFRKDANRGDAEFGIKDISIKPENINYEVTWDRKINLITFLSLSTVKMHKCYWDPSTIGQSSMKVLLPSMMQKNFI